MFELWCEEVESKLHYKVPTHIALDMFKSETSVEKAVQEIHYIMTH